MVSLDIRRSSMTMNTYTHFISALEESSESPSMERTRDWFQDEEARQASLAAPEEYRRSPAVMQALVT
jgi:hypothetical protein